MEAKRLIEAIEIIAKHHSTKMCINKVNADSSNWQTLVIYDCVPAVINELHEHGFMLGMKDGGLYVEYI